MEQAEQLHFVVEALERIGLRYFVTGSMATIFFGEPRFTNDIDIVVDLPADKIAQLCAAFPSPDFYLREETVRRAVSRHGQLNVIHPSSGREAALPRQRSSTFGRSCPHWRRPDGIDLRRVS
jgi:hypothetical protein